ncbi:allophanate hydrolase [Cellulomonas pakistanensis]|uniref:Allophanate hydrolase n=1 Tax=Cellulomonas pakistanensis TaxID=992287 RepID=A0A919U648_9CELL|nr:allophanate hydrolase [Cellulomonas pakistanensis]GIG35905.1 allophanate hydrolase [Cellulomonas pakistanensis]
MTAPTTTSTTAAPAAGTALDRVARAFADLAAAGRPDVWTLVRDRADVEAEARAVDARVAAGEALPLAGLVLAVKDNIDVAGLPTTAAHPAHQVVAERSATVVDLLRAAGAVVLGKTNLDQFATGLTGSRSPYGAVASAVATDRVSGGSSSGSAVAVALGIADLALGTDTAGSGRVPAAFNRVVGLKPTLGLVPKDGVVPACASYDCVTVLARDLDLARRAMAVMTAPSALDPSSRTWPADVRLAAPAAPVVAVPRDADLAEVAPGVRAAFDAAVARLVEAGATTRVVDLTPFLAAARLLYGGGLVAERYAAFGAFLADHPEGADPTVARIAAEAGEVTAAEYQAARDEVAALRSTALAALDGCDALLVPTAPEHPTLAEVAAAPLTTNARLGVFTNFVNLFDMAGVAMPLGPTGAGEAGVTVLTRAFDDQVALDLAVLLERDGRADDAGWRDLPAADAPAPTPLPTTGVPVVVFGAHLRGQPLHPELLALGARWVGPVRTAPDYRMLALATTPAKPLVHAVAPGTGAELEGEEYLLTPDALGRLLVSIPAPLGLGRVRTDDGRELVGFVGQPGAAPDAADVTHLGGWRAAVAASAADPTA